MEYVKVKFVWEDQKFGRHSRMGKKQESTSQIEERIEENWESI